MTLQTAIRRAVGGWTLVAGAVAPLTMPSPAAAQDAQKKAGDEPRATPMLGAVIVTADRIEEPEAATKTPLSIRETPQSISVVSRDLLDRRQVTDLGSAVELTAGVAAVGKAFAGNNPRTGEDFFLRGQELDSSRDVRVDGFTSGGDRNNFDL